MNLLELFNKLSENEKKEFIKLLLGEFNKLRSENGSIGLIS